MTSKSTYTLSSDLWKALHDAGLVPERCCDIIIEAPVGGVVKIHYSAFVGDTLPRVISAFAQSAKVVESAPTSGVVIEDDYGIFKDVPGNGPIE